MNFLKNLLIIAILGSLGYGIYVALARNNAGPGQPPSVAEGWPAVPKVELPSGKASPPPGGSLPLSGNPAWPASPNNVRPSVTPPPLPVTSTGTATGNPLGAILPMAPVTPYPSSAPSPAASAGFSSTPSSSPIATLGAPMSPDAMSAGTPANPAAPPDRPTSPSDMVRNLAPPPEATAASPADSLLQKKFADFMDAVRKKLDEGKLAEAHLALSTLYGNPDLPADQAKQINALLDQLAGTVIYSRRHYLEPAYVTQQGDTLEKVAQKYSIPWQLLARINGLMPPGAPNTDSPAKGQPLPPGMELKVVRGPFEAVVHLDKHELALMVQNCYAGRFPIGVGRDQPKLDGNYTVRDKAINPTYYGPDGVTINPNDPRNPLGGAWIGLTDRIGIHGVSDPQAVGRDDNRGTIGVGDRDLQDLYGILSVGSRVTIVR